MVNLEPKMNCLLYLSTYRDLCHPHPSLWNHILHSYQHYSYPLLGIALKATRRTQLPVRGSAAPHGALRAGSARRRRGPARSWGRLRRRHDGRSAAPLPPHPAAAPRPAARPARPGRPLRQGGVPEAQGGRARRGPALPTGMGGKCRPAGQGRGRERRGPAGAGKARQGQGCRAVAAVRVLHSLIAEVFSSPAGSLFSGMILWRATSLQSRRMPCNSMGLGRLSLMVLSALPRMRVSILMHTQVYVTEWHPSYNYLCVNICK